MTGCPRLRDLFYWALRCLNRARGSLWERSDAPGENRRGLDLGCGPKKRIGFTGLDRATQPGVDVVCDFERAPLPFPDETFDIVCADQVLEHVHDLDRLLEEIARIMKPGAKFQASVPYAGSLRAFQDPTHVRFFTLKTFEYFIKEGSRVGGWYTGKPFRKITRRQLFFGVGPLAILFSLVLNRHQSLLDLYEATFLRAIPARDLLVELEK